MTLNDLTVNFSHLDQRALLSDWHWLIGNRRFPILLTAAGDAFVEDEVDGSVHIIDVAAGATHAVARSLEKFRALLSDKDFVVNYFAVQMVGDLRHSGRTLAPGQIYGFRTPPILGGEYVLSNIEIADITAHFSINGQVHEQVAGLPPGTAMRGISIR